MPRSDENRQKEKAGLSLLICIKMILLGEAGLNKLHKLINSLLLVGTTCDDAESTPRRLLALTLRSSFSTQMEDLNSLAF